GAVRRWKIGRRSRPTYSSAKPSNESTTTVASPCTVACEWAKAGMIAAVIASTSVMSRGTSARRLSEVVIVVAFIDVVADHLEPSLGDQLVISRPAEREGVMFGERVVPFVHLPLRREEELFARLERSRHHPDEVQLLLRLQD